MSVSVKVPICFHGFMKKIALLPSNHLFIKGILGLIGLNLLLFGDILFGNKDEILSSPKTDLFLHFVAWREFGFDQLRQGHLVLWNPHYLCGTPFFGGFESALLYPPNWFYMVLPLVTAINFGIILHVFLGGLLTYLWAFHRKLHPLACFLAGTVFMFGGAYYLHLFAGHLPNLCTMVWAPLIFLAIDGLLEKVSLGWILLGIFAVSMQILAGHPQYVYFTAIIGTIYGFLNLLGNKAKLKTLGGMAVIVVGACLVTAVQLWTGFQAVLECGRNIPLEYGSAGSFSFPPQNILTLFIPEFFGNLSNTHYWSQWFLWEVCLFIGTVAFFLVVFSFLEAGVDKRRWEFTLTTVAFVFSLGFYTPLFRIFYDYLPMFKGFRGICKFDFLVSLFLALLAGIGLDTLLKVKEMPRWAAKFVIVLSIVLIGLGLLIFSSVRSGLKGFWAQWFVSIHWLKQVLNEGGLNNMSPANQGFIFQSGRHVAFSLVIAGVSFFLLFLLLKLKVKRPTSIYAIVVLSVLELFVFARFNRPTFSLAKLQQKFNEIKSVYKKDPGEYRVYGTGSASLIAGGYDVWEDEPMVLGRYGRFVCYSQGLSENQLFSVLPIYKKFEPIFGMLRLKYLISTDQDPIQVVQTPFKIFPRMKLVNEWVVIADAQKSLTTLFEPGFDINHKVILESPPSPIPASGKTDGAVEWNNLSTDEVEVKANLKKPALLLIADNYSPGWRAVAFFGSAQANYHVVPGNYFLQVIPLSGGEHHFLLEYLPPVFVAGKWVSIFSCLLYVGVLTGYLTKNYFSKTKVIS
jgi:hypothetical protein